MKVEQITDEGMLHWRCMGGEEDEYCEHQCMCHRDEAEYQEAHDQKIPGRGAVIALPACPACGALSFLKADYRLKELYKCLQTVEDEETGAIAYVLPLRYVRNLQVHWMLYQAGKAAYAPILDMPPTALLEHPSFASAKPSTIAALWFGYSTMRAYRPLELEGKQAVLLLEEGQA
jgi:hypothetical protein